MGESDTRVMGSYGVADVAPLESLAQLRVLAERDASRYAGADPTSGRRSAEPPRFGRVWRWSVRIGAIALLGIALWVLAAVGAILTPPEDVPADVASRVDLQSNMQAPAPTTGVYSPLAAQPAERLLIARERGVWRIRADAASRHEAAQTLAELSGTHLPAGLEALRSTRPLDLQWEGHDLAQAWQAVIGDEANYALKCSQRRCMAWLVAVTQSHEARGLTTALKAAPARVAAVQRTERSIEGSEPSAYD
ncbi:MAG: hypothetical protein SFZ23_03630 [Planctomycetota bacterium]|nr:hypothetical protein [Planctomycetota bacterium]